PLLKTHGAATVLAVDAYLIRLGLVHRW
ncbi:MAG: hypothetical protein RL670_43, partial [Actinomycetota bacterium]